MAKRQASGAPTWMVTFADMMSLLLALFVLMLSFSVMDQKRYEQIAGTMREAFGLDHLRRLAGIIERDGNPHRQHLRDAPVVVVPLPPVQADVSEFETPPLMWRLRRRLASEVALGLLRIAERDGSIVVSFPESVAFPAGSAHLNDSILPALDKLARMLAQTEGDILVAGHTDTTPIATERFRSNWDLSTARAVSVVHYWLETTALPASRLTPQGHGDSRPLFANDTAAHRSANRRVEVSIDAQ